MEELLPGVAEEAPAPPVEDVELRAVIEAIVYVAEEPLTMAQLANALGQPAERYRWRFHWRQRSWLRLGPAGWL